jgi:hypothetical protein
MVNNARSKNEPTASPRDVTPAIDGIIPAAAAAAAVVCGAAADGEAVRRRFVKREEKMSW